MVERGCRLQLRSAYREVGTGGPGPSTKEPSLLPKFALQTREWISWSLHPLLRGDVWMQVGEGLKLIGAGVPTLSMTKMSIV